VVKRFLDERDVSYELRRVGRDPEASADFRERGWLLPPIVEVGDEVVRGFDPERMEALIEGLAGS